MLASDFHEASGKTCSRTSARVAECAEAPRVFELGAVELGAFADGKVSVRTEAGVGVATGEGCGCATIVLSGFFSGAIFGGFHFRGAPDRFRARGPPPPPHSATALF